MILIPGGLASTCDEFESVRSNISAVFHLERRLPGLVFRKTLSHTLFCEYEAALSPELWAMFQRLAKLHGDARVDLLVVEPDHQSYYLDRHGVYPAMSLSVNSSEDDYWDVIAGENGGDIVSTADVIAITGASGSWGCWGERSDEILVVQGLPEGVSEEAWSDEFGPFLGVAEALENYVSFAFRHDIPGWYASAFSENYDRSS